MVTTGTKNIGFGAQMRGEVMADMGAISKRSRRLPLFAALTGYRSQFSEERPKRKNTFKNYIGKNSRRLNVEELRRCYYEVCERLNLENPEAVYNRTDAENTISRIIRSNTKLQYNRSVWIGVKNVDFLFPMLAGIPSDTKRYNGLALEINGKIHDYYHKMKKDQRKEESLHYLGIGVMNVDNADTRHSLVLQFAKNLRFLPRLDSRARERVWLRIYLETIICAATDYQLSKLFGLDFAGVLADYEYDTRGLFHAIHE